MHSPRAPAMTEALIDFDAPAAPVAWDADAEEADPPEILRKRGISSASRKNKGRTLQKECANAYKAAFPFLQGNDVLSRPMGSPGSDLILSTAALEVLPYDFEMKNVEAFSPWPTIDQSLRRCEMVDKALTPCLVARRNRVKPVCVVPLGHWMHLVRFGAVRGAAAPPTPSSFVSVAWLLLAMRVKVNALSDKARCEELRLAVQLAVKFAAKSTDQGELDRNNNICVNSLRIACNAATRFNFWKVWDEHLLACKKEQTIPALAFNRGDRDITPIYVAIPLNEHLRLLQGRWVGLHPQDSGFHLE